MTVIQAGDRVLSLVSGNVGTVKRVEGEDVRVRWDQPVAPGVTATWTAAHRLEVVPTTPGARIALVHTTDEHTRLQPNATGTVEAVDDAGTVHVLWDDGTRLGLIPGEDVWRALHPRWDANPMVQTRPEETKR